jgi:hypothetical protein
MRQVRILLLVALLIPALPARAATEEEGWQALGHALTLIHTIVRIGAAADPYQGLDDVLAGRNNEANRAFAGLIEEATAEMPPQYRDRVASIGRDLVSIARKQVGRPGVSEQPSVDRALQARKDLNAMGLRYHDEQHFLDAVKRDDALAVELFVAGRGVNLSSRDAEGRSALEIARANGNDGLADLLARSRPARR